MPGTAEDFWRMVTEHKIRTMVQLTTDGWLYYPEEPKDKDGGGSKGLTLAEFGSMRVSLDSVEDKPGYVARELTVYNGKADESVKITHFAFKKWNSSSSSNAASSQDQLPEKTQVSWD